MGNPSKINKHKTLIVITFTRSMEAPISYTYKLIIPPDESSTESLSDDIYTPPPPNPTNLLIAFKKERGAFIELSYPKDFEERIAEFKDKVNNTVQYGECIFLNTFDEFPDDLQSFNPDDFPHGDGRENVYFLRILSGAHRLQRAIKEAIKFNRTVFIENYTHFLTLFGYAFNCFQTRTTRQTIAFTTLLSFYKSLIQPDLIISLSNYNSSHETAFKAILKTKAFNMAKDAILDSKLYAREEARDIFCSAMDGTRNFTCDFATLETAIPTCILSTQIQIRHKPIKFY